MLNVQGTRFLFYKNIFFGLVLKLSEFFHDSSIKTFLRLS